MADVKAQETCSSVLSSLRRSGLKFVIHETPFSAYITIRKKFLNGFVRFTVKDNDDFMEQKKVTKLDDENAYIKNELKEALQVIDSLRNEKDAIQIRLENSEKEMVKHFADAKLRESKLSEEISNLKQMNKKCHDNISELKLNLSKEEKRANCLEKAKTKLESKNDNLVEQVTTCKIDKNNNKKEYDKLTKEVLKLKAKLSEAKAVISTSTQTEPRNFFSKSTSTDDNPVCTKDLDITAFPETESCLVCGETFQCIKDLKHHMNIEHDITINEEKLRDSVEEDEFARMLRSIDLDRHYIQERVNCYPEHWDHREERVKIRIIAQRKFTGMSKEISRNMAETSKLSSRCRCYSLDTGRALYLKSS